MTIAEWPQQGIFQVRFDWGLSGARTIATDADVVVWVDVLGTESLIDDIAPVGIVIEGNFRNRDAVARWILDHQVAKCERVIIAVIASGRTATDGRLSFAVEDMLAAGAVIDALAFLGIDYCSPEAAAACASFTGLKSAVAHILTASVGGIAVAGAGMHSALASAAEIDSSVEVAVLQEYDSQG